MADNALNQELTTFLKWFKENHPDLHEKYERNITIPFKEGGGVGVNNDYQLSIEEHKMLHEIAAQYYNPKPKV